MSIPVSSSGGWICLSGEIGVVLPLRAPVERVVVLFQQVTHDRLDFAAPDPRLPVLHHVLAAQRGKGLQASIEEIGVGHEVRVVFHQQ